MKARDEKFAEGTLSAGSLLCLTIWASDVFQVIAMDRFTSDLHPFRSLSVPDNPAPAPAPEPVPEKKPKERGVGRVFDYGSDQGALCFERNCLMCETPGDGMDRSVAEPPWTGEGCAGA